MLSFPVFCFPEDLHVVVMVTGSYSGWACTYSVCGLYYNTRVAILHACMCIQVCLSIQRIIELDQRSLINEVSSFCGLLNTQM